MEKTLDEILDGIKEYYCMTFGIDGSPLRPDEAKQALYTLILEQVIGEDENPEVTPSEPWISKESSIGIEVENRLREKQRRHLAEMFDIRGKLDK